MELITDIAFFLAGLFLIVKGADWLTDGAASIARRFGIPTLVIGLTIVAIGTSAPEFVVSMLGAIHKSPDIAIGNVVGSNIFNILGMMGATALISPILLTRGNVMRDLPIMNLAVGALFVMLADTILDEEATLNYLSRAEGLILLCFFTIYMYYTFWLAKKEKKKKNANANETKDKSRNLWLSVLIFLVGLGCLIGGGELMVDGASGIARSLGVSDAIIALTIVSIGTSAPELATSIAAARKGDNAMAVGNVVGSVVFNTLLILGASSLVYPLPMKGITYIDLSVEMGAALLFWLFSYIGRKRFIITRLEGAIMVLLQIGYYVWLVINK
ncbi:MAG: calcium/sodium antiporter [Bacteroidaceae bacterium]|nr:calcium/sodium antiporter [Bacteroidaceae bacterium]